ncbi:MAG: hypothetical protein PUA47_03805 [Bacteroidales bacterium]|nr:hypothetical protein [Bacteroidales bacterium]
MISDSDFCDGNSREFVPNKGLMVVNEDGSKEKDFLMNDLEGPLKIVVDCLSHGSWHTTYNILDSTGKKILPKGIRSIKCLPGGLYLLEDNNEDELINRGDVRGGFRSADYVSRMNVMRPDGTLFSEEWFDEVLPRIGAFLVRRNKRRYYLDCDGKTLKLPYEHLKYGCVLVTAESGGYIIYDDMYRKIASAVAVIFCSEGGLWNVNLCVDSIKRRFFHGQAPSILNYAQQVLLRTDILAIVLPERLGPWCILYTDGRQEECFNWDPYPTVALAKNK